MTGLPTSLQIAFWLVGSIWLVAFLAQVFDAPFQIVYAALAFGIVAAVAEWFGRQGR